MVFMGERGDGMKMEEHGDSYHSLCEKTLWAAKTWFRGEMHPTIYFIICRRNSIVCRYLLELYIESSDSYTVYSFGLYNLGIGTLNVMGFIWTRYISANTFANLYLRTVHCTGQQWECLIMQHFHTC